jgi:hypothetical protein
MRDIDGGLYYAQIRGLLTDQYCEKSCVVTWLLPTQASPNAEEGFDPATYIIGNTIYHSQIFDHHSKSLINYC